MGDFLHNIIQVDFSARLLAVAPHPIRLVKETKLLLATLVVALLAFAGAWGLTGLVRRLILSRARPGEAGASSSLLDVPNHRSSHKAPTPRGGGIAIVLAFLLSFGWLTLTEAVPLRIAIGLAGSISMVALIGFLDDWGFSLNARKRLVVHFAAAALLLVSIGGVPPFVALGKTVDLGWFGNVLAAVYLVWMVNLFNFMDGIDGIAAVEAITVSLAGALVWFVATGSPHWVVPVIFAAAVAGFLCWNLPPAKIFMGDAGSCLLGMTLGGFALWAGIEAPHLFWSWSILLGCFAVDATTTLLRRLIRGMRFDEAHRSHAYQFAARKWQSHKRVTYTYALVNILWLFPVASLVAMRSLDGVEGLVIAYAPLVWLAFKFNAGAPELQEEDAALRTSAAQAELRQGLRATAETDGA